MPGNHVPMSLLSTCRGGGFNKVGSSVPRTMPFFWANSSTFLYCHHELRRGATILDVEDPLASYKLRLLCYKRSHSMFEFRIHYFRWYYLYNKSSKRFAGQIGLWYSIEWNCLQRLPHPTTPSVLWSRTATVVHSREIFMIVTNLTIRRNHIAAKLIPVCMDIFIPWAQAFALLHQMNVYANFESYQQDFSDEGYVYFFCTGARSEAVGML